MRLFTRMMRCNNRYTFIINHELRSIFPNDFWYEYSELSNELPDWVAQIPLLANVAPVIWLMGLKVEIPSCEKVFWESLTNLKEVFQRLYPETKWSGEIYCENIFESAPPKTGIIK